MLYQITFAKMIEKLLKVKLFCLYAKMNIKTFCRAYLMRNQQLYVVYKDLLSQKILIITLFGLPNLASKWPSCSYLCTSKIPTTRMIKFRKIKVDLFFWPVISYAQFLFGTGRNPNPGTKGLCLWFFFWRFWRFKKNDKMYCPPTMKNRLSFSNAFSENFFG